MKHLGIILFFVAIMIIGLCVIPFPYTATETYTVREPYTEQVPYYDTEYYTEPVPYTREECTEDYLGAITNPEGAVLDFITGLVVGEDPDEALNNAIQECENVIDYRTERKSRQVLKYRTETKYKSVEKERVVTRYASLVKQWFGVT